MNLLLTELTMLLNLNYNKIKDSYRDEDNKAADTLNHAEIDKYTCLMAKGPEVQNTEIQNILFLRFIFS